MPQERAQYKRENAGEVNTGGDAALKFVHQFDVTSQILEAPGQTRMTIER